jgi:hypothetical protein
MAFSYYYRSDLFTLEEAIEFLWERDLINVGELAEKAIARNSGLVQNRRNAKGSDFCDNSDSKYTSVYHGPVASYATVSGIQNKGGVLRILVHEPKTKKNYYFLVPYKVYKPYTGADDSIKIWFDRDGNPRDPKRNIRENLWEYEVSKKDWCS